jgi:hypothetical protein
MQYRWSAEKDIWLRARRGISFEDVLVALDAGRLLATRRHHNADTYGHQEIYFVDIRGYVWMVPFVRDKGFIFLKTVIPTRKGTREFLHQGDT